MVNGCQIARSLDRRSADFFVVLLTQECNPFTDLVHGPALWEQSRKKKENENVGSVQTKKYKDLSRAMGGTLTEDELSFLNGKVVILLVVP
jgi:hypothetical protein